MDVPAGAARPRIVFLERAALPPGVDLRRPQFDHDWCEYATSEAADIPVRAKGAHMVLINKLPLSAGTLAQLPDLAMVAVAATGTDNVDLEACRARGIVVSNVRAYAEHSVPEHALALMLALRRNIFAYRQAVRDGRWSAARQFCLFDHPIGDLAGATLGIVGRGALGAAVGRLGAAFGMEVLFAARRGEGRAADGRTPFVEVLERSDIISLHCPLTPDTRGLIGRPELARMHRRPLLINTARGGLVDEEAVAEAVEQGQVSGIGFDVASREPLPLAHPLMRIANRPNVIVTPHVAWASREATQALADQLIANVEAFHHGAPVNVVAPG